MRAIIEGREEKDLTQKQLAEVTGITQADMVAGTAKFLRIYYARVMEHLNSLESTEQIPA